MYILRVVIFSLDGPNLTRILTVFKENLVKYKGKRISREYTFILFLILSIVNFQATQSSGKRLFTLYKIIWNKV